MSKAKKGTLLWRVGLLATVWWGITCFYLLLWVWLARTFYILLRSAPINNGFFDAWKSALGSEFRASSLLQGLLAVISTGWLVGALMWFKALKANNISYKSGLKDLFLTIRR